MRASPGIVDAIGVRVARLDPVVELLAQAGGELVDQVVDPVLAPHVVRDSTTWPSSSSTERSTRTDSSIPGRCTFTTTGEPSGSCARYTWPMEAAARGCQSKPGNTSGTGVSSSSSSTSAMASPRRGAHVVLEKPELGRGLRRDEVGAGRQHLPELHEHPAALLERQPQAPDRRAGAGGLDILLAPEPERRTQPVAHRDAGDLRVPLDPAPAPADRADGVRHRLEAGLGPDQHPGTGQELEPHRGRHRAEQGEEEEVAAEAVRRGMGVGRDPQRHDHADDPTRRSRRRGSPRTSGARRARAR